MYIRSALFWDAHSVEYSKKPCWTAGPLKMGQIGCLETSVRNYLSEPRRIPPPKKNTDLIYTAAEVRNHS